MENRNRIVEEILDIEVDMFLRVPTGEEPSCRAHMDAMKLHRRGQFAGWSEQTCSSYLNDLRNAMASGDNLMTVKYARMDNLVPPVSVNPRIEQIRARYVVWQKEVIARYPNTMRGGRDLGDFANYLGAELETYSDATLELLHADVEAAFGTGENLSLEVYRMLASQSGYQSLEEMEERLSVK